MTCAFSFVLQSSLQIEVILTEQLAGGSEDSEVDLYEVVLQN